MRYKSAGGASEKKKGKRRKGDLGRRKGAAKAKAAKARGVAEGGGGGLRSRLDRSRGARRGAAADGAEAGHEERPAAVAARV